MRKNNAKGKINKLKANIDNKRTRYLLKKYNVNNLEDVKITLLKDLRDNLRKGITDKRQKKKCSFKIWDIIICVVVANYADVYDWKQIEDFITTHYKWFKSFLQMTGGVPDHQTIERVFTLINHKELENILISFYQNVIHSVRQDDLINIDGRTSNSSKRKKTDYNDGCKALNVLSAYSNEYGICLASEMIDDKTNEIPTIPTILERLNIRKCTITWDALNTQTENVAAVVDGKADYVVPIKGNHPTFFENLVEYFDDKTVEMIIAGKSKSEYKKYTEKSHSSYITYEYFQTEDVNWYHDKKSWKKLNSIGMVKKTIEKNGEKAIEKRYYISSLYLNIEEFSRAIRNHWSVENKLHWHLDFTFKEDKNTTMNKDALMNLQIVNKFTLAGLNKVKQFYDNRSLQGIRKLISLDFENNILTFLLYLACC